MSILQISKIQIRSGNLVDLPQLDEAEFGWATDNKRLFIGKTTPNENVEILTGYSNINFSQINGAYGNLNINSNTLSTGEILTYDGTNWVNRGGLAGGNINLGNVSNIAINGGAIGYVLQTDGLGNLSWTPKTTLLSFIEDVTQASPAVVLTTSNHNLTNGADITITGAQGMTQLNGNSYYTHVLTANTFALYSDAGLTTPINSTGYNAYAFTSVTGTTTATNIVTVGNSAVLANNQAVQFTGNMSTSGIQNNTTYYINTISSGTNLTISSSVYANGVAGPVLPLQTTTGLTANIYQIGGQLVSTVGGVGSAGAASGSNTAIQYNDNNILAGSAAFTFDFANTILYLSGNANIGNLTTTGIVSATHFISNIATGTSPITVSSNTVVANFNANLLNGYSSSITSVANTVVVRDANANISGNNISGTLTTAAQPNITSVGTLTSLAVTGNITAGNVIANAYGNGSGLSALTGANVTGTLSIPTTSYAATVSTAAQPNITSVGTLTSLAVTGNITAGNVIANHYGNGSGLSALVGANVTGTVANATYAVTTGSATTAGTVTTNAQPNITSVGTLTSLAVTGNITAGNVIANHYGNGSGLSALTGANVTGTLSIPTTSYAATVSTAAQPNITSVGTLTSLAVTGNITAGNVIANAYGNGSGLSALTGANVTGTVANATYAVSAGSATTATSATTAGTVTTAAQPNITSVGTLTALTVTGNITAGNVIANHYGNGSGLSALTGANVTGTVANATYAVTAGSTPIAATVTTNAQPNITSLGTLSGLVVSGTINAGTISGSHTGNGSGLSALTGANVTGTVANATYAVSAGSATTATSATTAATVTTNAQPNITSVGTLSSLTVSANSIFSLLNVGSNGQTLEILPNTTSGSFNSIVQNNDIVIAGVGVTSGNANISIVPWSGNAGGIRIVTTSNVTNSITLTASNTVISGNLVTPNITTGANTTPGNITGTWTLTTGSTLQATYADLAEYYTADNRYEFGTVLEFGGDYEVTLGTFETTKVAGVVTTNPAYIMNVNCPGDNVAAITLQGRTPCLVVGNVYKGDMMVSAGNGYAKASSAPILGTVIGKSLENFTGESGLIEISISRA